MPLFLRDRPGAWRGRKRRDWAAAGLCALAILAPFAPHLAALGDAVFGIKDSVLQSYPWRAFTWSELRHGRLPLWDPYSFCGHPYFAEGQGGSLEFLRLLLLPLPVVAGLNALSLLHVLGAGGATFLYARRLGVGRTGTSVAALAFALSGWTVGRLYAGHLTVTAYLTPLPLALWGWETWRRTRRRWGLAVVLACVADMVFAGFPQLLAYGLLFLGFAAVAEWAMQLRRGRGRAGAVTAAALVVACALAGLVGAVQVLPTLTLAGRSSRAALPFEFCASYSLRPESLLALVAPSLFGNEAAGDVCWARWGWHETLVYVGLLPLLLAGVALVGERSPRVRFLTLAGLGATLLALGDTTPLLRLLYDHVPLFRLFRANGRFAVFLQLALAVLAGIGADRLLSGGAPPAAGDPPRPRAARRGRRNDRLVLLVLAAAVAAVTAGALAWFAAGGSFAQRHWQAAVAWRLRAGDFPGAPPDFAAHGAAMRQALVRALVRAQVFSVAALGLAAAWPWLRAARRAPLAKWALLGLVVADLWTFAWRAIVLTPAQEGCFPDAFAAAMRAEAEPGRCLSVAPDDVGNRGMIARIEEVTGYVGLLPRRSNDFMATAYGEPAGVQMSGPPGGVLTPALLLPGVRFVVLPTGKPLPASMATRVAEAPPNLALWRLTEARPRVYFSRAMRACRSEDEALAAARGGAWLSTDLVEPAGGPADLAGVEPSQPGDTATAEAAAEPARVAIATHAAGKRLLVLADSYDPDWRCTLDGGERLPILPVNVGFRGVVVPPGDHRVTFVYAPGSLRVGAAVSLLTAVGVGVALWRGGLGQKGRDSYRHNQATARKKRVS